MTTHHTTAARRRFDPDPDAPLGMCNDCGAVMADETALRAHLSDTFSKGGVSHGVRIENPPREDRIANQLSAMYDLCLEEFFDKVHDRLIETGDISPAELIEGLSSLDTPDLAAQWDWYTA